MKLVKVFGTLTAGLPVSPATLLTPTFEENANSPLMWTPIPACVNDRLVMVRSRPTLLMPMMMNVSHWHRRGAVSSVVAK